MRLQEQIGQYKWFHAVSLGEGIATPGRFSRNTPPNWTLFPVHYFLENMNICDMDCIDIGATDGIVSFILKQEGARRVVATDRANRETFLFLRDYLGLEIDYLPNSSLDNYGIYHELVERGLPTKYDLVILAGVIYHTYDPLVVMMHARKILKQNGIMIVETISHPGEDPVLYFNSECEKPVREPNTYFLPTVACLQAFSGYLSCKPLATIKNSGRAAILMQACKPNEIQGKSEILDLIIRNGSHYGPLQFDELMRESDESDITYGGRRGIWSIDRSRFKTRFSLQPR